MQPLPTSICSPLDPRVPHATGLHGTSRCVLCLPSGPSSTGRKGSSSIFQGAGHSPIHDGGSHPQDVFKVAMGIVTHCFASSRLLKCRFMQGSDIPVGCLPAWGGAFGPTHVTSAVGFAWLQRLGCPRQGFWEQRASQLCLHLVAPCSLPFKLWGFSSSTPTVQAPYRGLQAAERGWRDQHKVRASQRSKPVYFPLAQAQCGCPSRSCEMPEAVVGCQRETRGQNERQ